MSVIAQAPVRGLGYRITGKVLEEMEMEKWQAREAGDNVAGLGL
jgi:hypothetical protein